MEEKRIDPLQIIGFFLLFLVLIWMMYDQSEIVEQTNQTETETTTTEQIPSSAEMASINTPVNAVGVVADTLPEQLTTLQNKELRLAITSKGGFIHEAELINQTNYRKEQVYVVKDNNVDFNLRIEANGALINTRDLDFVPIFDGNQLIMRSSVA